ncbi:hypothetical protein ES708_33083 [subsurface metagenome]
MAEGREKRRSGQGARGTKLAEISAVVEGLDACESLWYPVVCLGVQGVGLLGDVDSGAAEVALVSF